MTATTSFHKRVQEFREIAFWSIRKNFGIAALLTVILFLAQSLLLLIQIPGWRKTAAMLQTVEGKPASAADQIQHINSAYASFLHGFVPVLSLCILFVFIVVLTVTLFGFMHKKRSVDLYHSLPVGRVPLLLAQWFAGIVVLFVPLILNLAAVGIIGAANGLSSDGISYYGSGSGVVLVGSVMSQRMSLMSVLGWMLLMTAAVFTFSVLIAVCSGSIFDTAVSVFGICVGYPLLILAGCSLATRILPGLDFVIKQNTWAVTALAPYAAAFVPFVSGTEGMSIIFLVWWLVVTPLMLAAACLLYRRRKSEAAEDNFAFPGLKIVIRFLVTALAGVFFGLIMNDSDAWSLILGILAGSLVTHVVVEAVYSKGFRRLKKSMVWYGAFLLCFILFYGVLAAGFFGFDTRVPNADDVESVAVNLSSNYPRAACTQVFDKNQRLLLTLEPSVKQPQNVKTVTDTQKRLTDLFRATEFPYSIRNDIAIDGQMGLDYQMKNGSVFHRSYQYFGNRMNRDTVKNLESNITAMQEYIESQDMIFYIEPEDIKDIEVGKTDEGSPIVLNEDEKKALVLSLQNDYRSGKINEENADKDNLRTVKVEFNDNIVPKNPRLKALLGNYSGPINLTGGGYYTLDGPTAQTWQLIDQKGWANIGEFVIK